jgi:hypothetical protein
MDILAEILCLGQQLIGTLLNHPSAAPAATRHRSSVHVQRWTAEKRKNLEGGQVDHQKVR